MTNDGGPAFPTGTHLHPQLIGMSLRAYLAGQALMGLMAQPDEAPCKSRTPEGIEKERAECARIYAASACRFADALLAALEETRKEK